MTSDRQEYFLKDLISVKHGYAFKGNSIISEDNGVVLVTPGNFAIGGGFQENKCKYFSANYPKDYILRSGDLIVTMTDLSKAGDTLGYSAIVPKSARIYLHNQRIGLVEIHSDLVDKEYLYWFMRTHDYQKAILASSSGSVIKHTSPSRIGDIRITLPAISKQKQVASMLSSIENKIVENKKINHHLEQMAQAIFKSWFVDFEPFGGTMPSDWRKGKLGDIAIITSGKRPPIREELPTKTSHIPLVGASCIMGFTNISLYEEKILITGRVGTHGIIQRFSCPCWASDNTLVIKSKYYEFTYQQLCKIDFHNMNRGSTQPLITQTDLKNVPIIVPTEDVLCEFEKLQNTIMAKHESNIAENERLAELRDTLLPRLMSGELSVSDIGNDK